MTASNSKILQVLSGQSQFSPPVWIMRQAGRYLVEYQNLRNQYSFAQLCESRELIVQVSMLPIYAIDVDAAIIFSDILTPPSLSSLSNVYLFLFSRIYNN